MSTNKQDRAKQNLLKQIKQLPNFDPKQQIHWLLRGLLVKHSSQLEMGFVLPTVAMVSLVVVLLSVALVVRAFDRSRNASNVRVNQVVLNAATPALDRAKAKIEALLNDPTLPRSTPSDIALDGAFNSNKYNFGDESRLKLVNNFGNGLGGSPNTTIETRSSTPPTSLENDETINTAWKYPVDTNNDGLFDSYTLYGVYFRSPSRAANGKFSRQRNPLEARTPPMSGGSIGNQCANANGTTANLVGDSSWYKSGSKLTKSFYVYTATVPITVKPTNPPVGASDDYQVYKGNKGFTALEYQQDRSRVPLNNNAVLFQDDIEISPGPAFRLNGRVITNANLLIGSSNTMRLYQVSSKFSCFYNEENSKITVGGNVEFGGFGGAASEDVTIDLFKGFGIDPGSKEINADNQSTTNSGSEIAYNDAAYNRRISLMKTTALSYIDATPTVAEVLALAQYPQEVKERFQERMEAPGGSSLTIQDVLGEEIEIYLRDRTRRVPFKEIAAADGTGAIGTYDTDGNSIDTTVFPSNPIEPPASWREPTNANTGLTLTLTNLAQTQPEKQKKDAIETLVGDRVYVGNNLPGYWKKDGKYVTGQNEPQFLGSTIKWNNPSDKPRYRTTQVVPLPDLGATERNGLWEDSAAQPATNESPNIGGLRVITGAGIYRNPSSSYAALTAGSLMASPTALDTGGTIPNAPLLAGESAATPYNLVWYDTTPMKGGIDPTGIEVTAPPDLRMRATAVYHYKSSAGTNQLPIACVSSYYDPTNSTLAQNGKYGTADGFPWGTGGTNLPTNPNAEITGAAGSGRSNNGVVYPGLAATDRTSITYLTELKAQAKLIFPNGRIVNEPLQKALQKLNASGGLIDVAKPLSLAENSAIDSAICAIKILTEGSSFTPSPTVIPHGAIKEAAFLNAREVRAIEGTDSNPINYDLALEQRQPSEIRVTEIDLRQLAITTIGTTSKQEYLLPNSGIIYASRDDALLDLSDQSSSEVQKKLLSPTDFRLDPTRRPTGIRLINGSNLTRVETYREEEKGLILASNLPVYVKADANNGFNLHQKPGGTTAVEEFSTFLTSNWSNFYDRDDLDNNFACRSGQTGCATGTNAGDKWRPATIISDTITALSSSFRDGFRNEGDFDLNNNAGTTVTAARKKNGFWNNNFVTSAFWWLSSNTDNAYPYEKTTNSYVGSYFINGVTPVQRRVDFPEYLMEYCPKIPVSLCTPSDWVINTSNAKATGAINATFASGTHQSGTTATAPSSTIERYARRLAFKRKSNNTLELTAHGNGESTPIPLGIDSSGVIKEFPYPYGAGTTATLPRLNNDVNNALWYQTSSNRTGQPNLNTTFETDQPLSYTGETKLVSPPTPEIPGVRSLNLPAGNPASGYTICTDNQGSTTKASISVTTTLEKPDCDSGSNPLTAIENTLTDLLALNPDASSSDEVAKPIRTGTFAAGTLTTLTQTNRTNVIDIGDLPTNSTAYTTIKLVGNENSIFVLRKTSSNLEFGGGSGHYGVKVELDGVDPNNVFWAVNGNMKWNAVNSSTPHRMSGTFINKGTGSPKWENLILEGGRILGVNVVPSSSNFTADTRIEAIASNGQPEVVPVLQVHTSAGTPSTTSSNLPVSGKIELEWLQNVTQNNTFNATFVAGNSPSRPTEGADDFENFVRFLERWSKYTDIDAKRKLNIRGSFIQLKRGTYATGPKNAIFDTSNGVPSLFPGYPAASYNNNKTPYAEAPDRQWGFDVGILAQSPDLFAQRFTIPTKTPPDEFFRQVGQDDPWVNNLLCAAEKLPSATAYSAAIGDQRPANCPALSSYPD